MALVYRLAKLVYEGNLSWTLIDPEDEERQGAIRFHRLDDSGVGEYCPLTADVNARIGTDFAPLAWQEAASTAPMLTEEEVDVVIGGSDYHNPTEHDLLFRARLLRALMKAETLRAAAL